MLFYRTKTTSWMALCALGLIATLSSAAVAPTGIGLPGGPLAPLPTVSATTDAPVTPSATKPSPPPATSTTTTTTTTILATSTLPPITHVTTTTTVPVVTTSIIITVPYTSVLPTTTGTPLPPMNTTCMSSYSCPVNQLCALQSSVAPTGICQPMTSSQQLCSSSPSVPCLSSMDCNDPQYSYCAADSTGAKVCAGLGRPGTATQCNPNGSRGTSSSSGDGSSVTTTLKYAGIAVGAVALLAIVFATVRWRRNKSRSNMPDFAEIDYGMSNRRSEPRSSLGASAAVAAAGEQSYPFSSRPHAHGIGQNAAAVNADQDGYYDDQYYDDGYAQNAHPMTGMAGGAISNQQDPYYDHSYDANYDQHGYGQHGGYGQQGYDQQGYDQQGYDQQYYKEAYNNGYDQHGNYVGDGGAYYDPNHMGGNGYEAYAKDEHYSPAAAQAGAPGNINHAGTTPAVPPEAVVRAGSRQRYGGGTPAAGAGAGVTGDYAVDN